MTDIYSQQPPDDQQPPQPEPQPPQPEPQPQSEPWPSPKLEPQPLPADRAPPRAERPGLRVMTRWGPVSIDELVDDVYNKTFPASDQERAAMRDIFRRNAEREQRRYPPAEPPVDDGRAAAVVKTIRDTPRQVFGGARDAAQGLIDGAYDLSKWLADNALGLERFPARPQLPDVDAPKTAVSGAVREISHFLTGFAVGGPVVKGIGITGNIVQALARGALADFAFFDGHEDRLSNLIESVPALKNPVTEFLAAKDDDNELVGRLKRAVEGVGAGFMFEGLLRGLKYMRTLRSARQEAQGDPQQALARELNKPQSAGAMTLLGDENAPAFTVTKKAMQPIDTGVPGDVAARSLTPPGMTPLAESVKLGKSVNINFARIESPDDVKRLIYDVQVAFKDDIDALRRGVRKDARLYRDADMTDAFDAMMKRREGGTLTDAETLALRRVWETSAQKLFDVAQAAAKDPTTENLYQFQRMLETHRFIQGEVAASKAEAGRILRVWGLPLGGDGTARLQAMENLLMGHGGSEAAQLLASRVAALKNLPGGAEMLGDIAEKSRFAKTLATVKELWVNALLSNPKTHIVNMMGNTASLLQNLIERAAAARFSQYFGSGEMEIGEAAAAAFASRQAIREGLRLFGQALKTGESQFAIQTSKAGEAGFERAISTKAYGIGDDGWFGRAVDALGAFFNGPVRFLGAEDDFFKAVAYRQQVAMRAFRQASKEIAEVEVSAAANGMAPLTASAKSELMNKRIAEIMASPPKDIHIDALDAALYQTFTDKPGAIVEALNSLERRMAGSEGRGKAVSYGQQMAALALRLEIPFRNTPANLFKYAFERTPLAPLMQRYREAIARGGADADLARTRMALGSFVMTGLIDLALDGHITGSGPSFRDSGEKGTKATLERSGFQPWSIRVGDKYISFRRTDPIGMSLGIAASIAEAINNGQLDDEKREDILKLIAAGTAAFAEQSLDRSYLQGIAGIVDALHASDPARHIERVFASLVVPGAVTEARRQVDPYMRYVSDLSGELRNRIPGLSSSLPAARDMWGRPRSYQSGLGQVYDAISPIAVRTFNPEPIDKEALKEDFNLMMPTRLITLGGQKFKLNDEQYSRLLELAGRMKPSEIGVDRFDVDRVSERGEPRKGADFVKKYGDISLLDLLNAIVDGKHAVSADYAGKSGGRNGGKDNYVTRALVGRYRRAAAAKLFEEYPDLKQRVVRGRAILPGDVRFEGEPDAD